MTTMLEELDEVVENEDKSQPSKICVDPGHGFSNDKLKVFDPGATQVSGGVRFAEAEIALQYGLLLQKLLTNAGTPVFMTRTNNSDPAPVSTRAKRATDAGCKRFVSIHLNSFKDAAANGVSVLFRDDVKDKPLAEALQKALVTETGFKDRGTSKRTNLAVLKFQPGPSVLIELGFISNNQDRNFLINVANRQRICGTIACVLAESPAAFVDCLVSRFFTAPI
jgi:N-acetylmuramoyl-L-alanine amidase